MLGRLGQDLGGKEQPSLGLKNFHLILGVGSPQGQAGGEEGVSKREDGGGVEEGREGGREREGDSHPFLPSSLVPSQSGI